VSGQPRRRIAREQGIKPGHVPADQLPPRQRDGRVERRIAQFEKAYGKAIGDLPRLVVVFDLFRSVARDGRADPEKINSYARQFTDEMKRAALELLNEEKGSTS
jgi:hypothetical protein